MWYWFTHLCFGQDCGKRLWFTGLDDCDDCFRKRMAAPVKELLERANAEERFRAAMAAQYTHKRTAGRPMTLDPPLKPNFPEPQRMEEIYKPMIIGAAAAVAAVAATEAFAGQGGDSGGGGSSSSWDSSPDDSSPDSGSCCGGSE